jgi:hypothetical protein
MDFGGAGGDSDDSDAEDMPDLETGAGTASSNRLTHSQSNHCVAAHEQTMSHTIQSNRQPERAAILILLSCSQNLNRRAACLGSLY